VLHLSWNLKDTEFLVDCEQSCNLARSKSFAKFDRGCQALVETCRKCTSFSSFPFHSRNLLSLQSCNQRQSHVDAKTRGETMVGINFWACISNQCCWTKSMKIDYLPFSEWRNMCSSATNSIIEIGRTNEWELLWIFSWICASLK
jgi:hypothetical protein